MYRIILGRGNRCTRRHDHASMHYSMLRTQACALSDLGEEVVRAFAEQAGQKRERWPRWSFKPLAFWRGVAHTRLAKCRSACRLGCQASGSREERVLYRYTTLLCYSSLGYDTSKQYVIGMYTYQKVISMVSLFSRRRDGGCRWLHVPAPSSREMTSTGGDIMTRQGRHNVRGGMCGRARGLPPRNCCDYFLLCKGQSGGLWRAHCYPFHPINPMRIVS